MDKLKREKVIFGISFVGSIVAGMVLITLGYYWLGMAITFVGCFGTALYSRKIAAKYKMGDERAEFIEGKTYSLTFRVIFITMGILLVILGGLFIRSIEISAYYVIGLLFALTSAVSVASRHYYIKKYS